MPLLAARMARFFRQEDLAERLAELHALECWSLGRCYDALDWVEAGIIAYRAALDRASGGPELTQILRELGYLYKRLERRDEAAEVWESWIGSVSGDDMTPYIELAKHHEWHTLDLAAARGLGRLGAAHRGRVAARLRARRRWWVFGTGCKGWNASWQGKGATALKQNSVADLSAAA